MLLARGRRLPVANVTNLDCTAAGSFSARGPAFGLKDWQAGDSRYSIVFA